MKLAVDRHTWVNTLVGMVDSAFALTEEELFFSATTVQDLLDHLDIPDRGTPHQVPVAVALEATAGLYSQNIHGPRDAGANRVARLSGDGELTVTLEAWRQALLGLLVSAYPHLEPLEVLTATRVLDELLIALGVPSRSAAYLPDDVVRAHLQGA